MNNFWKFNFKKNATDLTIEGDIASESWFGDEVTPQLFKDQLDAVQTDVNVHINSPGGDAYAGIAIYNYLRDFSAKGHKVTVYVDGLAASVASIIAMAGDEIIMSPGSMMMIHLPWSAGSGNADDLRKAADMLDQLRDAVIPIYAARSGKTEDEVKQIMEDETWYTAEQAVEAGFADSVEKTENNGRMLVVNMPNNAYVFSMSATRKATMSFLNKLNERKDIVKDENETKINQEEATPVDAPADETSLPNENDEKQEEVTETENTEKTEATEETENTEGQAEKTEEPEEPADTDNSAENEIADKIEARIKALTDENAKLKEENKALKEANNQMSEKIQLDTELQNRYANILSMAEPADGGVKTQVKPDDNEGEDGLVNIYSKAFGQA